MNDILHTEENTILRKRITEEIMKLDFELGNIGVQYVIETIFLIKKNEKLYNLEREVYPKVAEKFGVTAQQVKWNINSCINVMYRNCDSEILKSYFCYDSGRRPTPKIIIFTILRNI